MTLLTRRQKKKKKKKKKPAQLRCSCSGVEEPGNDEASSLTSHVLGSGIGAFQKFYILTAYTLFIRNEFSEALLISRPVNLTLVGFNCDITTMNSGI